MIFVRKKLHLINLFKEITLLLKLFQRKKFLCNNACNNLFIGIISLISEIIQQLLFVNYSFVIDIKAKHRIT